MRYILEVMTAENINDSLLLVPGMVRQTWNIALIQSGEEGMVFTLSYR